MSMMASSSKLFHKRGNPWYTRREQLQSFGRRPENENPDFDRYAFAKKAEPKTVFIDPPRLAPVPTFQRQATSIVRAYADKIETKPVKCRDNRGNGAHAGHEEYNEYQNKRNILAAAKRMCSIFVLYKDGREKEFDCKDHAEAFTEFQNLRYDDTVSVVELWRYSDGECEKRWASKPKGADNPKGKGNGK